ncbi:hypothetical protein QT979_13625 [Microcoleus sp. w2-18bC1]|uniref:hypothetical protein n=1 Tax=unclassified Microcoleus TaxID=2642155 RepID=UPI002FD323F0
MRISDKCGGGDSAVSTGTTEASLLLADRITGDRKHHRQESENLNSFSEAIAPWEIASKLHCFSQARIALYKKDRSFYALPAEYSLKP